MAVGYSNEAIFTVPWKNQSDGSAPTYNKKKINLECVPCMQNCSSCAYPFSYYFEDKSCYYDCPPNTYQNILDPITLQSECVTPTGNQAKIQNLNFLSMTIDGVQPSAYDMVG